MMMMSDAQTVVARRESLAPARTALATRAAARKAAKNKVPSGFLFVINNLRLLIFNELVFIIQLVCICDQPVCQEGEKRRMQDHRHDLG